MENITASHALKTQGCKILDLERIRIRHRLQEEQQKLEAMVTQRIQRGDINMGTDLCILKQSTVLDQLVVDEMKLDELCERYHKDQLSD